MVDRERPAPGGGERRNSPTRGRSASGSSGTLQQKIYDAGYAGIHLPGRVRRSGPHLEHDRVFNEEAAVRHAPDQLRGVDQHPGRHTGDFGTMSRSSAHPEHPRRAEELWLQFLSEPSGGSDLAGLLTSATRDGDSFVVNGQKTWSRSAHLSDFALCPVRTRWDVPKHKGISVLIVDLARPAIDFRRIKQIDGGAGVLRGVLHRRRCSCSQSARRGERGLAGRTRPARDRARLGRSRRGQHQRTANRLWPPWSRWSSGRAARRGSSVSAGRSPPCTSPRTVQKLVSARVSDGVARGRLPPATAACSSSATTSCTAPSRAGPCPGRRRRGRLGRATRPGATGPIGLPQFPPEYVDRRGDRRDPAEQRERAGASGCPVSLPSTATSPSTRYPHN